MAFEKVATVLGCPYEYQLSDNVKKYTLKDCGFEETNAGNFSYIRSLDATPQSNQGFKLKITITKDLQTLKMSITTANGLKAMDIFKDDKYPMNVEKFEFLIQALIDRDVLEKVVK